MGSNLDDDCLQRLLENISSLASPQDAVGDSSLFHNTLTDSTSTDITFTTNSEQRRIDLHPKVNRERPGGTHRGRKGRT